MDLLRCAAPNPKTPVLLRFPHDKENHQSILPLLKVDLSSGNNKKETNIFRLPSEYISPQLIYRDKNVSCHPQHTPKPLPKLIDIRSVINPIRNDKTPLIKDNAPDKEIRLIRLPLVKVEAPRLLDSPKRKKSDRPRQKEVVDKEQPLLIDIRPFTPESRQSPQLLKNVKTCKCRTVVSSKSSSRRASVKSPSCALKSHQIFTETENDDDLSIVNESNRRCKRKHKKRNKGHSNELYDVLSELLMERHKRKKHKRIGLFDIIDNIPLSSDSEVDDVPLVQGKRGQRENINLFSPKNKLAARNGEIEDNVEIRRHHGLPDPSDRFKSKSSFLDNKDALSWADIIKAARSDTQGTQTERNFSYVMISQEIQTEMKDMVEIPRTETFFKSSDDNVSKTTNDFCNRVRKEVVEKLGKLNQKEDKYCQTVCNAGIQTEEIATSGNYREGGILLKDTETPGQTNAQISHLPPDIHTEVYFHKTLSRANKDFINVVDIDDVNKETDQPNTDGEIRGSNFFKLESIDEYFTRISTLERENKDHEAAGGTSASMQDEEGRMDKAFTVTFEKEVLNDGIAVANSSDMQVTDNNNVCSEKNSLANVDPTGSDKTNEHILSLDSFTEKLAKKQKKRKKLKSPRKESLQCEVSDKGVILENINEFSVGLNALNHIQENLEKELRHSKFLYGMIETLQDGFLSDSSQEQTPDECSLENKSPMGEGVENKSTLEEGVAGVMVYTFSKSEEMLNILNAEDAGLPLESLEQYSVLPDMENRKVKHTSIVSSRNSTVSYEENDEGKNVMINKVESMKDKLYKQELQMKICKTMTSEEMKLKREAEKKAKLLKWIQKKKLERHKQYRKDLGKKRETEHHPFVPKGSISGGDVKHNMTTQAQNAKRLLAENNQERLQSVERLATSVISKEHTESNGKGQYSPGKHPNNRYKTDALSLHANNIPPIPETRASMIRKSALRTHILKNQQLHKDTGGKPKQTRVAKPINKKKKTKSKKAPSSVVKPLSKITTKKDSLRKSNERFDFSGRRSVEASDFVTMGSYDKYMTKSSKLLQETMQEYKEFDNANEFLEDVDFQAKLLTSSRLSNFSVTNGLELVPSIELKAQEGPLKLSSDLSLNSSINNNEVKGLLTRYGMNVGEGLFDKTSGTSQLLAEVDLALLDESDVNDENLSVNGAIDWDEIDKILDE